MSQFPTGPFGQSRPRPLDYATADTSGTLVSFFNAVYAWMAGGLALTAVVAWYVFQKDWALPMVHSGIIWILLIAELGLVVAISAAVNRIGAGVATALFLLYAALNGITLSIIFQAYTTASLARAFFVTAGTFGATSVYGMVTRRDLTRMGSLLFMALIGLILATVVNMFWQNSALYWISSYLGVIIFVGLTAWDTQKLKILAMQTQNDSAMTARMAIVGSLALYLDFINLFLFMLRFMGKRR